MSSHLRIIATAIVDDEPWYEIVVCRDINDWILTELERDRNIGWARLGSLLNNHVFDVHEKIYLMLLMRWQ